MTNAPSPSTVMVSGEGPGSGRVRPGLRCRPRVRCGPRSAAACTVRAISSSSVVPSSTHATATRAAAGVLCALGREPSIPAPVAADPLRNPPRRDSHLAADVTLQPAQSFSSPSGESPHMTQTATAPAAPTTASNAVMNHRQILLVIYGLMAGMFLGPSTRRLSGPRSARSATDLHGSTAGLGHDRLPHREHDHDADLRKLSDIFGPTTAVPDGDRPSSSSARSRRVVLDLDAHAAGFRALQGPSPPRPDVASPLANHGRHARPARAREYQGYFPRGVRHLERHRPLVGGVLRRFGRTALQSPAGAGCS